MWSLFYQNNSLLNLLIISEMLIILFFLLSLLIASIVNINWLLGFSLCYLILGGLELSLSLLLLAI